MRIDSVTLGMNRNMIHNEREEETMRVQKGKHHKVNQVKFGASFNIVPEFLRTSDWDGLKSLAAECEGFGYDSAWVMDHFAWDTGPNILECWTTLSALAASTSKIRLGSLVLCNSYRHPPLLAKMAATLDVISKGRLEFGIGAGWRRDEYLAHGIPFPPPAIRVAQLREAITVIKKLWTEEKPSFNGKYYHIQDADFGPKPVQRPHPPVWIGAFGERLMLRVVAEFADGWNIVNRSPEQYAHKVEVLKKHCIRVNRDINDVMKSLLLQVVIGKDSEQVRKKVRHIRPVDVSVETFSRTRIVGTPDECIQKIKRYQNLGMTHFIVELMTMTAEERRLFAEEVMPAFR